MRPPRRTFVWGRRPPPIGGVTRSVEHTIVECKRFVATSVVDLGHPPTLAVTAVRAGVTRRAVSIANISTMRRGRLLLVATSLLPHRVVLFFHGGSLVTAVSHATPLERALLRIHVLRRTTVWATNAQLMHALGERGVRTKLVSPVPISGVGSRAPSGRIDHFVLFASRGNDLYGGHLAIEALEHVRSSLNPTARLSIVVYGGLSEEGQRLLERARARPWITLMSDLSSEAVASLLAESDVLLRLTETDGDSLVVRDALAHGVRVLATDTAPRPKGVELCERSVESVVRAISSQGRLASGVGLGVTLDVAIADLLEGAER